MRKLFSVPKMNLVAFSLRVWSRCLALIQRPLFILKRDLVVKIVLMQLLLLFLCSLLAAVK